MTKRPTKPKGKPEKISDGYNVSVGKTAEETAISVARAVISPEFAASRIVKNVDKHLEELKVSALAAVLAEQTKVVTDGNMKLAEAMLFQQATALQTMFSRLAECAMSCDHIQGFESNMRMALRAQSQCRATLETLSAIKNPPVIFAKQANIAQGHQQINNGNPSEPVAPSHAGENQIEQNELLEHTHGERLDTRETGTAGKAYPAVETVGAVNRAENGGR